MSRFLENTLALCGVPGVSGDEGLVREAIIRLIGDAAPHRVDAMGNLIVEKRGAARPKHRIVLDAHMDEIGFVVTGADEMGLLRFDKIGSIDDTVLIGKAVSIGEVPGVIGGTAVHLLEGDDRRKVSKHTDLRIDIGAKTADEALGMAPRGSGVVFDAPSVRLGEHRLRARALDDRMGCAALVELILSELPYDITFLFSTREETGLQGAKTAVFTLCPDIAVTVECTTAGDLDGVKGDERVCALGDGVVVPYMDARSIYDKELYALAFEIAKAHDIPIQTKTRVAGGTNAGSIIPSRSGVRVLGVAVPSRCLHSPGCVVDLRDADAMLRLLRLLSDRLPVL